MTATIHKINDKYYGHEIINPSCESFGLLRIPGQNGEPADQTVFRERHHHKCAMLPLNHPSMPFKSYKPEEVFSNWGEYPELHTVTLIGWDTSAVSKDIKAQILG